MTRLAAIALVLLLGPLGPLDAQNQTSVTALPSVDLPAELSRVLRDYERAWRSGDAAAVAALFTEDGFVLQPGRPPMRGRAGLEATYRGQGGGDLRLRALAYAVADSVAFIVGAYRYGDATSDMGKFTLTLRRPRGGRWLIFSDMDNGNAPIRRPTTPPSSSDLRPSR